MADEPSLPRMPPSKAADAIFGPARKRVRLDLLDGGRGGRGLAAQQLLSNSSDPAVFSSDDDPALDNYAPDQNGRSRKKKRYVGAWFAQHPASTDSTFDDGEGAEQGRREPGRGPRSPAAKTMTLPLLSSPVRPRPKKRTFERQFDSGVWMGKDGGGGPEGDEEEVEDPLERAMAESPPPASQSSTASTSSQLSLAPTPAPPLQADFPPPPPRQRRVFQRVSSLAVNNAEEKARSMIQTCIEAGDEEVSLIGLGLTALSNATIEPLSGLVPIPVVTEGVAFEQKDPKLKLFLSSNNLTRLPGALFNLEHLTVLSLRGNGLTELPPAIGKLRNLKSLNVSLNRLRFLPAELLPLIRTYGQGGRLVELLVHPNPYFAPEGADENDDSNDDNGKQAQKRAPRHISDKSARVARSPVRYMDSTGKTWSSFTLEPAVLGVCNIIPTEDLAVAPVPPWSTLPHLSRGKDAAAAAAGTATALTASRVPTLVEFALEACYRAPELGQLADLLPSDAPPHLARQLARALAQRDRGGCTCSVCRRPQPLVAPMTEWLEWWEFAKSDINVSYSSAATSPADDEVDVLPFVWRGCSWGCVPRAETENKEE